MFIRCQKGLSTLQIVLICGVALVALPLLIGVFMGARDAKVSADRAMTVATMKSINNAIGTYYEIHKQYPESLKVLYEPEDGPPFITQQSMQLPEFAYQYATDVDDFNLRLNPRSGAGPHYLTNKSGIVRVSQNSPATDESPEWSAAFR